MVHYGSDLCLTCQINASLDRQSSTWGVRLGQLLLAAKKQDAETFYEKLKLVRKEQVVPLSAASYECGTYQRGYEYIIRSVCVFLESIRRSFPGDVSSHESKMCVRADLIRLHMLSELEHTFTELQKQRECSTPTLSQLPPHWSDRLEMTQNSFRAKDPILALRRALFSLGPQ